MTILLAPMEGLLDFVLRDVLTRVGGIDRCVSEFIRITDQLLPERVFTRIVPELNTGGRTLAGVPVRAQLLGSDPVCLAENAARLAELGPAGIDLNFGCPAKVVNRHGGGAALLDEPETIAAIVAAVRRAVPAHMAVSAKMRLGFNDDSRAVECAQAIAGSGADELVVHARTREQAYRPPAYWERIADIRAAVQIPVVANGEIWTVDDAHRCRQASGCDMLMLGRGVVTDPGLGLAIKASIDGSVSPGIGWLQLVPLLSEFWHIVCTRLDARSRAGRLKQWLNFLRRRFPEAETAYQQLRTINDPVLIDAWLAALMRSENEVSWNPARIHRLQSGPDGPPLRALPLKEIMTSAIHTASIPVFKQLLGGLSEVLGKAEARVAAKKIDPAALLQARLFPDMFSLLRQVQVATDFAKSVSARLAGVDVPKLEDTEQTFAELQARIATVLAFIEGLEPALFDEAATREIVTQAGTPKEKRFTGHSYLFNYGLPHFFFHTTTAYAILRHNGVEVGKKDYIGSY